MRKLLLISLLCSPAFAQALSLKRALQLSLAKNPDLQLEKLKTEEAEGRAAQTRAGLYPSLSLGASGDSRHDAASGSRGASGSYHRYSASLEGQQVLLKGAALWAAPSSAARAVDIQRVAEQVAERDHIEKMLIAFYEVLFARRSRAVYEKQIELQKKLLAKARERLRQGAESRLTLLQFETQLALLEPKLTAAQTAYENAITALQQLVAQRDFEPSDFEGSVEALETLEAAPWVRDDSGRRLELRQQELRLERFGSERKLVMAEHFPSLTLDGAWGRVAKRAGELDESANTEWTLGLHLKVPLLSGLSSLDSRRILAAQEGQLRVTERSLRIQSQAEAQQIQKDLVSTKDQLRASRKALALAEDSQKEAGRLYQLGRVDYPRLFDTQSSAIDAEVTLDLARKSYLALVVRSYVVSGRDLHELVDKL